MPGRRPSARFAAVVVPFCLFVAAILGVLSLGAPAPAVTPAATPTTAPRITVTNASPAVATDGGAVTLRGTIRNTSDTPLDRPMVTAVAGPATTTRAATRDWAASRAVTTGATLGSTRLKGNLAPGQRASWRITVAKPADHLSGSFGVVPVSVQAAGAATHTFIAAQRTKEYEPLGVTWVVPLTLDADPDLFGATGADRLAAWRRAVGPDSRVRRLLETTAGRDVVWAIDPTLLTPPPARETSGGETERDVAAQERELRIDFRATLQRRLRTDASFLLPGADADVAAAATSTPVKSLVLPQIQAGEELARSSTSRADVLWPVDGLMSPERERALTSMAPNAAILLPDTVIGDGALTPDAGQRTTSGTRLLVSDQALAALASPTGGALGAGTSSQQRAAEFIAESAAIVAERAGSQRSVLIALPRDVDPAGSALRSLLDATTQVPWMTTSTLDAPLERATTAAPTTIPSSSREALDRLRAAGFSVPRAQLSTASAARLKAAQSAIEPATDIRADGAPLQARTAESVAQLTSVRWRAAAPAWEEQAAALDALAATTASVVRVSADDVNFFANSGRLQLTVRNTLPVAVENVRVRLVPTSARLTIDEQPEPLRIGANSRQVVTVQATAHGPGMVSVNAVVTAPDGTSVAKPTALRVKVQPTGNSIYWVVGVGAALLVGAGTWRSLRQSRRRRAHAQKK